MFSWSVKEPQHLAQLDSGQHFPKGSTEAMSSVLLLCFVFSEKVEDFFEF